MSNTEKCGLSNSEKPDDEIINSNHRNIRVSTRDEKLIAELKTHIPDVENIFDVHRRIGEGTFSTVFLATLKCHSEMPQSKRKLFAVKFIVPTSHPNRIERELKCLLDVGGSENIVGVNLCLRQNNSVAFVMPYIAYDKFHTYVHKMNARDLQDYMRNLLIALKRVHSFGIIHRDVKPSNFLHDRKNKKYLLVDFGLAQFVSSREDSTNVLGETSTTRKRKASEINETGKSCALNTAKRARTQYSQERPPQQEQLPPPPPQQSSAAVIDENDPRLRSNLASIPLLQFKLPLKENNKLPGLKDETQPDNLNSPLTQQIKSTVLSYSLREKLTKKKMTENSPTYTTGNRGGSNTSECFCFRKPTVCNLCLIKKEIQASRAGTPGYRPPEVLLKNPNQTTAVDIWASGVIMVSILSGCYPFFKASDDFDALAEITTVFGGEVVRKTAEKMSRHICMSRSNQPLHLRKLCVRLRRPPTSGGSVTSVDDKGQLSKKCDNCQQKLFECLCENSEMNMDFSADIFPDSAYDLMSKLFTVDPQKRISAAEALDHPFFKENM